MYTNLTILFSVVLLLGFLLNYLLFRQDKKEEKSTSFFTSERFVIFIVEILIAVIGFGATLAVTNANEREMEKEKAAQMLGQIIEYMDSQVDDEHDYLVMYDDGELTAKGLLVSSVVNTEYYESVLTNELILQNVNMKIHGEVMRYLTWGEQATARAKEATDDKGIRRQMWLRYAYHLKMRNHLQVSYDELTGAITADEAEERRAEIHRRSESEEVKIYEGTPVVK